MGDIEGQGAEMQFLASISQLSREDLRAKIAQFEANMKDYIQANGLPEVELPLKHSFTDGLYVREISVKAGMLIVTKLFKQNHATFILKGRITVVTEDEGIKELIAPCSMITKAGTKRALYTHEDTIWITVHANPTNETDLSKIEDVVIAKTYKELGLIDPIVSSGNQRRELCHG